MKTVHKMLIAKSLYFVLRFFRLLVGKGDVEIVKRGNVVWNLDLREGIDLVIYLQGRFEPLTNEAYRKLICPGYIVLDIGANIGAHTLHLANAVGPEGKVIAFEPTGYAYNKLTENIKLNPGLSTRIVAEHMALGRWDMPNYETSIYSSWLVANGKEEIHPKHLGTLRSTEGAELRRLDSYIEEYGISKVDFIKIDVDGFECDVFAGASNLLKSSKPIICMEIAPYIYEEQGASLDELVDILVQNNYRFYRIPDGKEIPASVQRFRDMIGDESGINIIAAVEGTAVNIPLQLSKREMLYQ